MGEGDRIIRLNGALEGRYRIEKKLGEGGMAMVHLAEDLRHERKVAHALDHAHRQGVVHRDIKPSNVLLHDGEPVTLNWFEELRALTARSR